MRRRQPLLLLLMRRQQQIQHQQQQAMKQQLQLLEKMAMWQLQTTQSCDECMHLRAALGTQCTGTDEACWAQEWS
jgi:hypothetical protein